MPFQKPLAKLLYHIGPEMPLRATREASVWPEMNTVSVQGDPIKLEEVGGDFLWNHLVLQLSSPHTEYSLKHTW